MLVAEVAPENRAQGARSLCLGFAVICVALMVPVLGLIAWASLGVLGLGAAAMAVAEGLRQENSAPTPLPQGGSAPVSESPVATASAAESSEQAPLVDLAAFARATFLARTGAFLLDCLLVALLYRLLGLGAGQWFATLLLVYHIALWTWKGTTVGGIILQMRLVRTDGQARVFHRHADSGPSQHLPWWVWDSSGFSRMRNGSSGTTRSPEPMSSPCRGTDRDRHRRASHVANKNPVTIARCVRNYAMALEGIVARIVTGPHDANRQDPHLPMRYDAGRARAVIRLKIAQPRTTSLACPAGLRARRRQRQQVSRCHHP